MTTGIETAEVVEPWLYATLTADEEINQTVGERVYGALTPDDPDDVYITFALMSSRDVRGVGQATIDTDSIYLVKAVAPTTSQDDVLPAALRISALLTGRDEDTPYGHVTCTRETTVSYAEVTDGQPFLHLGFTFRIRAIST